MNPIGLLTFYLFRVIALSDVSRAFLKGRKLRHCIVQGPATIAMGNGNTISSCTFVSCDFVVVEVGSTTYAALPMENCEVRNVRFQNVTWLISESMLDVVRRGLTVDEGLNVIRGRLAPIGCRS